MEGEVTENVSEEEEILLMKVQNPHDKFFKETLGNVSTAKDFLMHYLPESIMNVIDVNTLDPQKDSFINEELEENFSDLLFKVDIANKEGYLYFLFEHKSYSDKGIAFQLLKYMIEIWEAKMNKEEKKELPIIIPLVIHHGRSKWRIPSNLGAMLDGYEKLPKELKMYVPNFNYLIYDLTIYSEEEIKGKAQTRILLTLFRDIFTKDKNKLLESVYRSIHYLNELEDKQTGMEYFETMMRYIFSAAKDLTKKDVEKIIERFEKTYPEGSEIAMTLADMWREEGVQQGMQQGMEQGIQKGLEIGETQALTKTATRLLTKKFYSVPEEIKERISKLDTIALELLIDDILDAETVEDIKKYLQ